jgi:signal transduction histidine kinase
MALGGWLVAGLAGALAMLAWRSLWLRMDAVARACHELRGPLTAARLGLALGIRTGRMQAFSARAIDLELERAGLALDDLAQIGRPKLAGRRPAPPRRVEDVDLQALLTQSVEAFQGPAARHRVALGLVCAGAPALVRGDRLRLAQVVGNVIGNAVEHGGATVEVRLFAGDTTVRIEVADDGPGLPAPVRELARRARGGPGRRGRGLAIALAIAEEHGGRLAAAPSERGARVVLELPACGDAAAGIGSRSPTGSAG